MGRCARTATLCSVLLAVASPGLATSTIRWQAPEPCDREHFLAEVERLTGRHRDAFELGADVSIVQGSNGTWTLTLATSQPPLGETSSRVLRGRSCGEVTTAGSVALAMAIRAAENEAAEPPPAPAAAPVVATRNAPRDSGRVAAPIEQAARPRRGVDLVLTGALAGDSGLLPNLAGGLAVEPGLRLGWLRLGVLGYFLGSPRASFPGGGRGTFLLIAASPLVCVERQLSAIAPMLCAGYEFGRISGEGEGVTHPRLGSAGWQGARLDFGLSAPPGAPFRFTARVGGTLSLERPIFVLDGAPVHRPAAVGLHALVGIDLAP